MFFVNVRFLDWVTSIIDFACTYFFALKLQHGHIFEELFQTLRVYCLLDRSHSFVQGHDLMLRELLIVFVRVAFEIFDTSKYVHWLSDVEVH